MYVPGAHRVQTPAPAAEYEPTRHSKQLRDADAPVVAR
jgi:hypothetical protein